MSVLPFFTKTPSMECVIALDFADDLPEGVTISSCTVSSQLFIDGVSSTATLFSTGTNATIDGSVCKINVTGGTSSVLHEVVFRATLSDGQILDGLARLMVDN